MVTAKTKNGTEVYCYIHEDCGENKGGFFVEICLDEDGERYDDIVVHKNDCDCTDLKKVEKFVAGIIEKINEY